MGRGRLKGYTFNRAEIIFTQTVEGYRSREGKHTVDYTLNGGGGGGGVRMAQC